MLPSVALRLSSHLSHEVLPPLFDNSSDFFPTTLLTEWKLTVILMLKEDYFNWTPTKLNGYCLLNTLKVFQADWCKGFLFSQGRNLTSRKDFLILTLSISDWSFLFSSCNKFLSLSNFLLSSSITSCWSFWLTWNHKNEVNRRHHQRAHP